MKESQQLPGPRCREMVDGGVMSYPCMLPLGHDGPHEAVEVPASSRRRNHWIQENSESAVAEPTGAEDIQKIIEQVIAQQGAKPTVSSVEIPEMNAEDINPYEVREQAIVSLLQNGNLSTYPSAVSSWVTGMMCMTSLSVLWTLACEHFDQGSTHVALTREVLERVVPEFVRVVREEK